MYDILIVEEPRKKISFSSSYPLKIKNKIPAFNLAATKNHLFASKRGTTVSPFLFLSAAHGERKPSESALTCKKHRRSMCDRHRRGGCRSSPLSLFVFVPSSSPLHTCFVSLRFRCDRSVILDSRVLESSRRRCAATAIPPQI